jgi:hypothetical protein
LSLRRAVSLRRTDPDRRQRAHRWFEDRGAPCFLLVFIDDATGKLMQLRFVPSESTSSYFDCLRGYLEAHGCPVAFYSDVRH